MEILESEGVQRALLVTGYEQAPSRAAVIGSMTGRLLSGGLRQLAGSQRERYAEEWAADLAEIHGRFARFRWCFGIWRSARRLARTAAAHSPAHHG